MKLAKIKVFLGLMVFMASLSVGLLPTPTVSAASKTFINANGQSDSGVSLNRFQFVNPFNIYDSVTQKTYVVDSGTCDNDALFGCNNSDKNGNNGYWDTYAAVWQDSGRGYNYWYWPSSDGKPAPPDKNTSLCPSALVLGVHIGDDNFYGGTKLRGASLSIVNTAIQGKDCFVHDGYNRIVRDQDVTGRGVAATQSDATWSYNADNGSDACSGIPRGSVNSDGQDTTWDVDSTKCIVDPSYVVANNLAGGKDGTATLQKAYFGLGTFFHWTDTTTLTSYIDDNTTLTPVTDTLSLADIKKGLDGGSSSVKALDNPANYTYYSNESCVSNGAYKAILAVQTSDPTQGTLLHRTNGDVSKEFSNDWNHGSAGSGGSGSEPSLQAKCLVGGSGDPVRSMPSLIWQDPNHQVYSPAVISLADYKVKTEGQTPPTLPGAGSSNDLTDSSNVPTVHCDVSWNPLTWFLCPIANMLIGLATSFDNLINDELCIQPASGFGTCGSAGGAGGNIQSYKAAWSTVRDIALGVVVIIGLIAIISQASGVQIFDAYTIKKTMPRLVIAAVAVSLSWPLMNWFIQLTNDLGYGVRTLIYHSVSGAANGSFSGFGGVTDFFTTGGVIYLLGIGGVVCFAATAALFGAVAVLVLTLRQIIIICLVITGPLAIMLYAAPYGQKLAGRWWQEFTQLTFAFPIVAAAIAAGHVFGAIALKQSGNGITQLIGFAAYFAGDAAVLGILAKRGAILGAATSAVRKGAQPAFGFLDKRRKANLAARGKRWQTFAHHAKAGEVNLGNYVSPRLKRTTALAERLSGRINRVGVGASAGWQGAYGFGQKGAAYSANAIQTGAAEAGKEEGIQKVATDNATNRLLVWGHHYGETRALAMLQDYYQNQGGDSGENMDEAAARAKVQRARANVRGVVGGYNGGRAAAAFLNMARDGTAIRDIKDQAELAAIAGHGDESMAYTFSSQASSVARQVGRSDLAIASEPQGKLIHAVNNAMMHGIVEPDYDQAIRQARASGAGGETASTDLTNAKSRTIKNKVESSFDTINRFMQGADNITDEEALQAAAVIQAYQNSADLGYGKVDNIQAFNETMTDQRKADFEDFLAHPAYRTADGGVRVAKTTAGRGEGPRDADGHVPIELGDQISVGEAVKATAGKYYSKTPEDKRNERADREAAYINGTYGGPTSGPGGPDPMDPRNPYRPGGPGGPSNPGGPGGPGSPSGPGNPPNPPTLGGGP